MLLGFTSFNFYETVWRKYYQYSYFLEEETKEGQSFLRVIQLVNVRLDSNQGSQVK